MASRPDRYMLLAWIAATGATAVAWWFGSGLHPLWWLTWLAPLPVLALAPRVQRRWAALASFTAFAIGGLNQWTYLHDRIGVPLPAMAGAIGLPALALACGVLLFRRLLLRGHAVAAAFALPALYVSIEYINSLLSPHGTFGSIAYTQMDALPVIQMAAVTGIWGISFMLLLMPGAAAALTAPQPGRRSRAVIASIAVAAALAMVTYAAVRLREPPTSSVRIGLVSMQQPIRPELDSDAGQALQARYLDAIGRLAGRGARIVVIPETSFSSADPSVPAFAQAARRGHLTLDIGMALRGAAQVQHNAVMVFRADADMPITYSKHHLIPGFEHRYTPGTGYRMLPGVPRIGLAICKDMDFHDIGHAYAARHAQLLLVPAWDFGVDGWLHARMAIMRGVESGFAVARAARSGRLTLSDDRGRVVAEASSEQHDADSMGDLPLRQTRTLYQRWGDAFAWVSLVLLAALMLLAWRPGHRPAA